LEPRTSFDVGWFNDFIVVVDEIKEVSTFSIQCLESHFPLIDNVVAIGFLAVIPRYFAQE